MATTLRHSGISHGQATWPTSGCTGPEKEDGLPTRGGIIEPESQEANQPKQPTNGDGYWRYWHISTRDPAFLHSPKWGEDATSAAQELKRQHDYF